MGHRTSRWLFAWGVVVALAACGENEAATKKCKSKSSSDDCQECCEDQGASGYKFINGDCGCLGG